MSHIPTQGQKGSIGEGESDLVVSPSLSFSVHLTHTLLIFHLDQRPLLVYKSRAKAPGVTKVHVNTKNRLLSAQLRRTASSSQTERRDEGQNVFCFFFPTGFATFLQLVLCPLVPPPLSG